jgi:hypothetical protein
MPKRAINIGQSAMLMGETLHEADSALFQTLPDACLFTQIDPTDQHIDKRSYHVVNTIDGYISA